MTSSDKPPLEAPFAHLYAHGIRFSTLLADWCKYAGYSRTEIAAKAHCTDRALKSAVQRDSAPTDAMRQAMITCLGFDPWSLAHAIDLRRKPLRQEDLVTIRTIRRQETHSSDPDDLADPLGWPRIDDEDYP